MFRYSLCTCCGGCSSNIVRGAVPERCALDTIPDGKSVACPAPEAVAWYPEREASSGDIPGRAVDVRDASDVFEPEEDAEAGSSGGAVPSFNTKEASGSTSPVARCVQHRSRPRAPQHGGQASGRTAGDGSDKDFFFLGRTLECVNAPAP